MGIEEYRDGTRVRLEAYQAERSRVVEGDERVLKEAAERLPGKVLKELRELRERLDQLDTTPESIGQAEQRLRAYQWKLNNARNLLAQLDAAEQRERNRTFAERIGTVGSPERSRFVRQSLAMLGVVSAMVGLVTIVPSWLLDEARSAAGACTWNHRQLGSGVPKDCDQEAKLLLPSILPWKSREAGEVRRDVEERKRWTALVEATAATPNAAARAQAAGTIIHHAKSKFDVARVAHAGAFESVATAEPMLDPVLSLRAARALGDFDRIRTLTQSSQARAPYRLDNVLFGAWQCLLNDREQGIASLSELARRADSLNLTNVAGTARFARLACGGRDERGALASFSRDEAGALRLLRLTDPAWRRGRRHAVLLDSSNSDTLPCLASAPVTALWLLNRERSLDEVLNSFSCDGAALTPSPDDVPSPWTALDQPPIVIHILEPDLLESAAATLERFVTVDTAPDVGAEPDFAPLRKAARTLLLKSALTRTRRGQREQARAALARAETLIPSEAWMLASAYAAAGAAKHAHEILEAFVGTPTYARMPPAPRAATLMTHALTLASLGRWKDALDVGRQARETSARENRDVWRDALTWLVAALSVKTGAREPLPRLIGRAQFDSPDPLHSIRRVDLWLLAARGNDEDRLQVRIRLEPALIEKEVATLPAVIYLAGALAEGAGDIEVWLDRVFAKAHLEGDPRWYQARAEAARWRGDDEAAKRWDQRADRAAKLIINHQSALLASVAFR